MSPKSKAGVEAPRIFTRRSTRLRVRRSVRGVLKGLVIAMPPAI